MNEHTVTLIDLLRHGQPTGGRRFRGSVDDPLSDRGWQQMHDAVGDHCPWGVIVSSPLSRCADFARELSRRHRIPLEFDERLRELSFGIWDGQPVAEIGTDILDRFWKDPVSNLPERAEPIPDFDRRVTAFWRDLTERHAGRHSLVVCHGAVMRVILRHVLDMPLTRLWRLDVPYACLSRIRLHSRPGVASPQVLFHAGKL